MAPLKEKTKIISATNKGFTLFEVVIGLAILSGGIVAVLQALAFSSRITGLSCDTLRALILAEDKLGELDYKTRAGLITEASAESGRQAGFKWSYALAQSDEHPGLYKFDLDVNWQRGSREENLELSSWLLKSGA